MHCSQASESACAWIKLRLLRHAGPLPESWSNLTFLQQLSLGDNALSGMSQRLLPSKMSFQQNGEHWMPIWFSKLQTEQTIFIVAQAPCHPTGLA